MPKGKNRKKGGLQARKGVAQSPSRLDVSARSSDDESTAENVSTISNISGSTIYEDTIFGDDASSEDFEHGECFEEKLCEAIDGMAQKSVRTRTNSLESMTSVFSRKFIPDFIVARKATIIDSIERCLKKGRGLEQSLAAHLAALLCVQLGATDIIDEICNDLIPALLVVTNDSSMPVSVRAKCCWAVGLLTFIGNYDDVDSVMNCLQRNLKSCSCTDQEKTADTSPLHTAAISATCLLLTVNSAEDNNAILCLSQIAPLLESSNLDVCLGSGEIIAVMLEQTRRLSDYDEDWEPSVELVDRLKTLTTGALKHRTKKDRRTQRSAFRDIIRYIENNELPRIQVKFGKESLSLDTWSRRKQYGAFCEALGSGINLHLTENDLLRDVLNLGDKVQQLTLVESKQNKLERNFINAAAFKARTICRGRNRDKRSPGMNNL